MSQSKKILSVFSLVMINVIAVDSLRTLPLSAKLGLPLVFYYCLAAFVFFIPVALVSAELATAYPQTGGIYIWVREAFGKRAAFITIWLQWIYNVVWFPTIMAFIGVTIAYLIAPQLAQDKRFLLLLCLGLFWLFTLLNCFGMRVSSMISTIAAIVGTLLPMMVIIALGCWWLLHGQPVNVPPNQSWLPDFRNLSNLPLFSAVLFGLLGMEMSAVHAEEVKNPQRDYPRALLYSTVIIFLSLVLSSLSIVIVIPNEKLSVVSGLIDSFAIFFKAFGSSWMTSVIAVCIILGALGGVSAWMAGPAKGLMVAARDGSLPVILSKMNKKDMPVPILILQAVLFTLLCSVFIVFDSINTAYWLLSDLCAQMALLVYVFMFSAAIKLRYSQPEKHRAYRVPGKNINLCLTAGAGIACCLFAMLLGFVPPAQIPITDVVLFESWLVGGLLLFVAIPWILAKRH